MEMSVTEDRAERHSLSNYTLTLHFYKTKPFSLILIIYIMEMILKYQSLMAENLLLKEMIRRLTEEYIERQLLLALIRSNVDDETGDTDSEDDLNIS